MYLFLRVLYYGYFTYLFVYAPDAFGSQKGAFDSLELQTAVRRCLVVGTESESSGLTVSAPSC